MVADPRQPQRLGVLDECPKHPAAARQVADRVCGGVVDAARDEALELGAVLVEHADRRVTGAGQLARGLQHMAEHRIEIELGDDEAANIDQGA